MFVKLETGARHSLRLRRCSDVAVRAWYSGLELAQECCADGAFEQGLGPMTLAEIAEDLHINPRGVEAIAAQLVEVGLWGRREDGCYFVHRFSEKTTPKDPRAAERMRNHRANRRNVNRNVTAEQNVTLQTEERSKNIHSPSESAPRAKKDLKPEPDTAWVDVLKAAFKPIYGKRLRDLTINERVVLSRYHAYRWGNCTQHEPTNAKRSQNVLKGLGGMCVDATYGELTVKEYVKAADTFTEKTKAGPWYDPWLIKSVMVAA